MAINFGDTIMEGGIEPSVTVQAPVEDNSGAILARGFAPAAEAIGGSVGGIFKANQEDANSKILTSYENELLDLADAVNQKMSRNEAMIRARNLRREYLANSPSLQTDFDKIWSNFATDNGLGNVVVTGTVEQQIELERNKKAGELGYTPQEYAEYQAVANQATALNHQLEIIKARGGIVTETMKNQSIQVMAGLADKAFPAAQSQINSAISQIEANPAQKAEIAQQTISNIKANVVQLEFMTGGLGAEYITTPIDNLLKSFEDWSAGTIEKTVLENETKLTQLKYDALYSSDPALGPVIAQSKLLNDLGLSNSPLATSVFDTDVVKRLKEVSDQSYTLNILGQQPGDQKLVQMLDEAVSVNLSDEAQQEVAAVYAQIIDGAWVHERSVNDPLAYQDTIEALGSPAATEFFKNNEIPAQYSNRFAEVIGANYQNVFIPAVSQYWTTTTVGIPAGDGNMPSSQQVVPSDVLDPVWNGNVVEFVPKPGYEGNIGVANLAREVNTGSSSIGIPMNNLIRAIANVTGQDAKAVWESQFAGRVFGISEDGEPSIANRVNAALDATATETPTLEQFNFNPEVEFEQASSLQNSTLPPVTEAYVNDVGINWDSYLPSIRASESGGNDSAKNPSSTALGRYQFLTSTWNGLMNKYPEAGLTADGRTNPSQQEKAIRLFTAENARYLQNNGIGLNNGTLYAAHFLGAGDAAKVLIAPDTDQVAAYVPAKVINANPFLRGMSVGQFKAWAQRKGNA